MKALTKLLSIFLTLCLVLSITPATALAFETETPADLVDEPDSFEEIEEQPVITEVSEQQVSDAAPVADEEVLAELPVDADEAASVFEEPDSLLESPAPKMPVESPSYLFTKQPENGIVAAGTVYTVTWSTNFLPLRVWLYALDSGLEEPVDNREPLQKLSEEELLCGETEISPTENQLVLVAWYNEYNYVLSSPFTVKAQTAPVEVGGLKCQEPQAEESGEVVDTETVSSPEYPDQHFEAIPAPESNQTEAALPEMVPNSATIFLENGEPLLYTFLKDPKCRICEDKPAFHISWETSYVPTQVNVEFETGVIYCTFTDNLSTSMSIDLPFEDAVGSRIYIRAFVGTTNIRESGSIPWSSMKFSKQPAASLNGDLSAFSISWTTSYVPTKEEIGSLSDGSFQPVVAYTEDLGKNMTTDLSFDDAVHGEMIVRAYYGAERYLDSAVFSVPWHSIPLGITFIHSCAFGNNLSIGYLVKDSDLEGYSDFWLDVSGTELRNYSTITSGGVRYYRFVYSGIAAKQMGDELTAILYATKDGETLQSKPDIYSVKTYAYNQLGKSQDNTFKRLLVDMLNYGAAAQVYFNYDVGNPVNKDLTDAQKALGTPGTPTLTPVNNSIPLAGATASFAGKNVAFQNSIALRFYMQFSAEQATENVKLVLSYTAADGAAVRKVIPYSEFGDYNATTKHGTISSISAKDMGAVVTAVIYDGDTPISETVKYSIETYAYNQLQKSTDENFKTLVTALMKYGKSAEAYFSQQH